MVYIADLHVHSHYSRATSRDLNLESLYQWARIKGIHVVGTGDFTHPAWFKEIREKLEPDGSGLFRLKKPPADAGLPGLRVHDIDVRFCLTTEISSIYKYGEKVRKNHNLVYAPDFETVARINTKLAAIGNLESDGRPILGLPSRDLLEIVLGASPKAYLIPAHVWTPWFSTLGSKGGYDSVDECFRDLSGQLFAIETGLSSDPVMNRKWSALDRFTLISNSDAHSAQKLGREANVFDTERSYDGLFDALKTRKGFMGTYEFFPEEGKYFHDGHRACNVSLQPGESAQHKGRCPVCGDPLTIGVLNRVEELIDRETPETPGDFRYIIPLPEILAEIKGAGPASKGVMQAFQEAIATFGNEFSLLNEVPVEDIQRKGNAVLAEAIRRMRQQEIRPVAGYDGVYGVIRVFGEGELKKLTGQMYMFGEAAPAAATCKPQAVSYELRAAGDGPRVADETPRGQDSVAAPVEVKLNEAQTKVSAQVSGALLVKAGPGTGKTSTLVRWIASQLEQKGVKPEEVMAITFTNKAAREIKERLVRLVGPGAQGIRIGTFHAIAYQLLQEYDPRLHTVYDEQSRHIVLGMLFPELKAADNKKICKGLEQLFEGQASLDGRTDAGGSNSLDMQKYASRYRTYLEQQAAVDLSDIVGRVIRKWEEAPALLQRSVEGIKAMAIDEVQDINAQQYEFFRRLGKGANLLAIGDPDQAIYGFRGSDTKLFFQLEKEFRVEALTENYRCPGLILAAASGVIGHNTFKSGVALQATRPQGGRIRLFPAEDPGAEARYIIREIEKLVGGFHQLTGGTAHHKGNYAFSDIAVLFRTHSVGRELLSYFRKSNIPVHLADGSSFLSQAPFSLVAD
ncbi:MAG TPA: UvrD-helicase domain-containing protein, partial [Puia sp.]|nr:UvrD-helicase domain-containing protein [Puia sp.]